MKRILSAWLIALVLLSCSEAPVREFETYERVVLCELFTHIRCTYCPYAAKTLDSLEKEFNDSIAIIAYHRRRLGDTLSPSYVENRANFYYSDNVEPTVFFDGDGPIRTEDPQANYSTYKGKIEEKRVKRPPLLLYIVDSLFANTLKLKTTIVKADTVNFDSLYLLFVLTEDSVRCFLPGGSDSLFQKVMRLMWPDEQGVPLRITSDTLIAEWTLPWRQDWQKERFQLVVFIQDKVSKEVLGAVKRRFL